MTSEIFLLTLLLTFLAVVLPVTFWLMTRALNKATQGLIVTTSETTSLLSQAVSLLSAKDPLAFQQIMAATTPQPPIQEQTVLVTDNYPEVDEDEYDFAALRKEYGVQ
jgi:hypothetical protein